MHGNEACASLGFGSEARLIGIHARKAWAFLSPRHQWSFGGAAVLMAAISVCNTLFPLLLGRLVDEPKLFYKNLENNVRFVAFGGQIDRGGDWRLSTRAYLVPEGGDAKWLAGAEPLKENLFAHFDADRYLVAAAVRLSKQFNLKWLVEKIFSNSLPAAKIRELAEKADRVANHISELGISFQWELKDKSLENYCIMIARVDDAEAFVKDAIEMQTMSRDAANSVNKVKMKTRFHHRQIAGKKVIVIEESFESSGKTVTSQSALGILDARTVFTIIAAKDNVEAGVEQFLKPPASSLSNDRLLAKTAKLLAGPNQLEAYLNLSALAPSGIVGPIGLVIIYKDCPPLGFAMRTVNSASAVEAQFVIPYDFIDALFKNNEEFRQPGKTK